MTLTYTINERLFTVLIDSLVWLNRHTIHVDTEDHDHCTRNGIKCHMLERQCGAPWSLLLAERRRMR